MTPRSVIGTFLNVLVIGTVGLVAAGMWYSNEKYPDKKAEAEQKALSDDISRLQSVGLWAVANGYAQKFDVSGWNSSLDLHIGTLSAARAATIANGLCTQGFTNWHPAADWHIRVYLVDGHLAAECPIVNDVPASEADAPQPVPRYVVPLPSQFP